MTIGMLLFKSFLSIIISVAFAVLFQAKGRNLFWCGINGGIGYFVLSISEPFGSFFSALLASMAIMVLAEVFARVCKSPTTIFLAAALIPITPGGLLYNGMIQLFSDDPNTGLNDLYEAFVVTVALAVGIVFMSSVMRAILAIGKQKKILRKK